MGCLSCSLGRKKKIKTIGWLSALWSCITFYCGTVWVGIGNLWLASLVILILLNVSLTFITWCFQDKHNTAWIFLPFLKLYPRGWALQQFGKGWLLSGGYSHVGYWPSGFIFVGVPLVGLELATFRMCPWIISSSRSHELTKLEGQGEAWSHQCTCRWYLLVAV